MSTLLASAVIAITLVVAAVLALMNRRIKNLEVKMSEGVTELEAGIQEVKGAVGALGDRVTAVEQQLTAAQAGDDLTAQVNELHSIALEANAIAAASLSAIPPTGDTTPTTPPTGDTGTAPIAGDTANPDGSFTSPGTGTPMTESPIGDDSAPTA